MPIFTLDPHNRIRPVSARQPAGGAKGIDSSTAEDLATLASTWPGSRLVEIWNNLPGVVPVRKFTDRKTAIRRIWKALSARKVTAENETDPATPARNTKTQQILALLNRPSGATLQELMSVTGWRPHSIRGFVSGQLAKKRGIRVHSFKRNGERVYRIRPGSSGAPRKASDSA